MNLEPLGDRLIVQPDVAPEVTEGGIIVPDSVQEKPLQGLVIAVGPGKRDDNGKRTGMDVEVGNVVLYAKYSGTDACIGEIEYLILNEHDILAKVKDEPQIEEKLTDEDFKFKDGEQAEKIFKEAADEDDDTETFPDNPSY